MSKGRYITFEALSKIAEAGGWTDKLWMIVGNEEDTKNYTVSDETFLQILQGKGLIPSFQPSPSGDTLTSIGFDPSTSELTLYTDKQSFTVPISQFYKVGTITERDALITSVSEQRLTGSQVYVADTTGDPGDPQPKTYRYDGNGVWFTIGEGSGGGPVAFNGNRTITRNGIPNINVGGTTIEEFANNFFFPAEEPTAINPSLSIVASNVNTKEVGTEWSETVTLVYNRGSVRGKLVNGVWNPNIEQGPRAGIAEKFYIDGQEILLHNGSSASMQVSKTITAGAITIPGAVDHFGNNTIYVNSANEPAQIGIYPSDTISKSLTLKGDYYIYWGAMPSIPTSSSYVRNNLNKRFYNNDNVFEFKTNKISYYYGIFLPKWITISEVKNISINQELQDFYKAGTTNSPYRTDYPIIMPSGIIQEYNFYLMSLTAPYGSENTIRVTLKT